MGGEGSIGGADFIIGSVYALLSSVDPNPDDDAPGPDPGATADPGTTADPGATADPDPADSATEAGAGAPHHAQNLPAPISASPHLGQVLAMKAILARLQRFVAR